MQIDDSDSQVPISQKERARLQRKKAYDQAKEQRKTDPRFIALRAKQKQQRHTVYQKAKAYAKAKKGEPVKLNPEMAIEVNSLKDQELMATMMRASQLKSTGKIHAESESKGEK